MSNKPQQSNTLIITLLIILMVIMIAVTGILIYLCIDLAGVPVQIQASSETVALPAATAPAPTETEPPETTLPEPEKVIATATISSQGDLLMHKPVFDTCRQSNGSYDFESIFRYVKDTVSSFDYALANLETTFGGDDFVYQGNPAFNCPDGLADSVVEAGYDMLLTTNNHCGDTMAAGVKRTVELVRSKGLTALGTQLNDEEPKYAIVEINGIKVGMVGYSWAYSYNGSKVSMNGLTPIPADGTINFFMNNDLESFYADLEGILAEMKAAGAEATMMQIHWGVEYSITENATQNKIAQKLCDMGFDVIVGGHPHVVQPMELLTSSTDPDHKTICIYSLGNAVSNQRVGISDQFPSQGYTEDGVIFAVTFEKYSDGKVYVSAAEAIPTWVNMRIFNGSKEYSIVPLDKEQESQWSDLFELEGTQIINCESSYARTMGIIGQGLQDCQNWLAESKEARDAYYLDLATNPEKYVAPAETPAPEVIPETTAETLPAAA